ncbi:hypothetical protein GCM10009809_09600 [Isoptericola hypogeus]|uniref:Uncharacterized protein n=1 Tax=Isoptericola hypogeus TaxID=300179 RepID=A0ABN2J0R7_9MICO
MKARSAWIVSGALGAVGLGATVATAQGMFDAPEDDVVSSAVQVGDAATSAGEPGGGAGATPSPADVQNGSSITTVTAGSAASPATAPTSHTPTSPASPVTAQTPVTPASPTTAQTAQTAQSAASAD